MRQGTTGTITDLTDSKRAEAILDAIMNRTIVDLRSSTSTLSPKSIMAWMYLIIAGLFEISWAVGLKYTDGFTRLWPSVWTVASMAVSLVLLSKALRTIPVGTGYAVWTGVGAAGTALVGMFFLGEPRTAARFACLTLIVAGIVGLKIFS